MPNIFMKVQGSYTTINYGINIVDYQSYLIEYLIINIHYTFNFSIIASAANLPVNAPPFIKPWNS